MPNTYKNKVVVDGTTLIDLTADTVTAADVASGKTFHLPSGAPATGTAAGVEFPTFTATADEQTGKITSVTCDKTYAECRALIEGGNEFAHMVITEYGFSAPCSGVVDITRLVYVVLAPDVIGYIYYSSSKIKFEQATTPTPSLQSKTATPTESQQVITPDSGYDGLSSVTVGAISSTYVGSGITRRSSTDLTASGATVSVPAGYYESAASKAVASGTAGTPTATKGSVSNHSVSVTPSITNTTGYITGGTKSGTAVSVSASELVSGTLSITSSGTKDVTNYASASVAAGGATASATKGSVSNHSVTVTPSVTRTAGYVTAGTASGTAVTVSASELVSGSETKTANGTYDVTNLASVTVAIDFVTYYTSTSAPTSSQGSDGDVWLVTS